MTAQKHGRLVIQIEELRDRVAAEGGRKPSYEELADAAGVHGTTVRRYSANEFEAVNLDVLAAILGYFQSLGCEVEVGDLLRYESATDSPGKATPSS